MNRTEIVLLGPHASGKTSLLRALLPANHKELEEPIAHATVDVPHAGTHVNCLVWDLSGKKRFSQLIDGYMHSKNNFCIVLSASDLEHPDIAQTCTDYLTRIYQQRQTANCAQVAYVQFVVAKDDTLTTENERQAIRAAIQQATAAVAARQGADNQGGRIQCLAEIPFCSSQNNYGLTQLFNPLLAQIAVERIDEPLHLDKPAVTEGISHVEPAQGSTPTHWKTHYARGKNTLIAGFAFTIGLILTTVFQNSLPKVAVTAMNLGFSIIIAGLLCLALGMMVAAIVSAKRRDHAEQENVAEASLLTAHPWQRILLKLLPLVALTCVLGWLQSTDGLYVPVVSDIIKATASAFGQINFPSLNVQLTIPPELVAVFVGAFLVIAAYLIIDSACRIYNYYESNQLDTDHEAYSNCDILACLCNPQAARLDEGEHESTSYETIATTPPQTRRWKTDIAGEVTRGKVGQVENSRDDLDQQPDQEQVVVSHSKQLL